MKKMKLILIFLTVLIISAAFHLVYNEYSTNWKIEKQKTDRITKTKQDCETIVQGVQKFKLLYGRTVQNYRELKNTMFTGIDTLKDPWGNLYIIDSEKLRVISMGPDGILNTLDDISQSFNETLK